MTELLLRLFVPEHGADTPRVHGAIGRLAGLTGIGCNLLLAGLKILAGLLTGSVAIVGDGINNLTDCASSLVTLLGFRMAQRPADGEHPFGHGRYEYVSGVVVAALVLMAGAELAKSSIEKMIHPQSVEFSAVSFGILIFSILLKLWMTQFNRKLARRIHSATLEATAQDSRNDIVATSAVALSCLAERSFGAHLDGVVGMGVAGFILWSGISLARSTVSPLIGMQADETLVRNLTQMILAHKRILGIHDLLIHDYGPGHIFATVHAEMDASEPPLDAHDQLDHIEQEAMRQLGIHLVIHYDPIPESEEWAAYRRMVEKCASRVCDGATLHDLRVVDYQGEKKLAFDLAVPYSLEMEDGEVISALQGKLQGAGCNLPAEICIDREE